MANGSRVPERFNGRETRRDDVLSPVVGISLDELDKIVARCTGGSEGLLCQARPDALRLKCAPERGIPRQPGAWDAGLSPAYPWWLQEAPRLRRPTSSSIPRKSRIAVVDYEMSEG